MTTDTKEGRTPAPDAPVHGTFKETGLGGAIRGLKLKLGADLPVSFDIMPDKNVVLHFPPRDEKRSHFGGVRPAQPATDVVVPHPQVYLPATAFKYAGPRGLWDKLRYLLQVGYKSGWGWIGNKFGLMFFVFFWYLFLQNRGVQDLFNNPDQIWWQLRGVLGFEVHAIPKIGEWYTAFRHFNLRDGIEFAFRGAFAVAFFTSAVSIKRQLIAKGRKKHSLFARIIGAPRIWRGRKVRRPDGTFEKSPSGKFVRRPYRMFPTEVQPEFTRVYQWPTGLVGMFLFAVPWLLFFYGLVEATTLLRPSLYQTLIKYGLAGGAFFGALFGVKVIAAKYAVDFQNVLMARYRNNNKVPGVWWPSNIRALGNSDMIRKVSGSKTWLLFLIVGMAVVLAVTYYGGSWIFANKDWLGDHNMLTHAGLVRLLHGTNLKYPTAFWTWVQSLGDLNWNG